MIDWLELRSKSTYKAITNRWVGSIVAISLVLDVLLIGLFVVGLKRASYR